MDIIKVENVSKQYTNHLALDQVSLDIPKGSIYGLLGPNGAGKTTLIRIINHITLPDKGSVIFDGHPLTANDVVNIGYLPEERGLYKKMRVGEQALFFAKLKGLSKKEAVKELQMWFERFGIMEWWNKKVEELSKGMAQKVQFIVTVLHKPKLLIFDEPFSGFDPINAELLKKEILTLRDNGSTVIFSTHNMESVESLCDNFTLINRSRNILSGNVAEIRHRMGRGRLQVSFTGQPEAIVNALGPTLLDMKFDEPRETPDGLITEATLHLDHSAAMPEVIAALNSAVGLMSLNRALPGMNEIFIRAVEESNEETADIKNS